MIRYLTAGESHGEALIGIVEGVPAGLELTTAYIDRQLARRWQGFGRGGRAKFETDTIHLYSGVRFSKTMGSPIAMRLDNAAFQKDKSGWPDVMAVGGKGEGIDPITLPRPGHADLTGAQKYGFDDIRPVIDRASARETAMRVACCTVARRLLAEFGIRIGSHVVRIGEVGYDDPEVYAARVAALIAAEWDSAGDTSEVGAVGDAVRGPGSAAGAGGARGPGSARATHGDLSAHDAWGSHGAWGPLGAERVAAVADESDARMLDAELTDRCIDHIKAVKKEGDSLGGVYEVIVTGVPPGLGSYAQWDRRLDGQLAQAILSIQGQKAVEVGDGVAAASRRGSDVHDEIGVDDSAGSSGATARTGGAGDPGNRPGDDSGTTKRRGGNFPRATNRAGGVEGGMSNGMPIIVRGFMKPIPTLIKPLGTVDMATGEAGPTRYERSDVTSVPAASTVAEAVVAQVIANAFLEKFGGDHIAEIRSRFDR